MIAPITPYVISGMGLQMGLFLAYNDLRNTASFAERGLPEGPLDRTFVVKFTKMLNVGG